MRDISQSQWVDCDSTRRYVGLNLSQHPVLIFVGGIPSIAAFVCFCMTNFQAIMCSACHNMLNAFTSSLFCMPKYIRSIFWSSACVFFPPLLLVSCHSLACLVSSSLSAHVLPCLVPVYSEVVFLYKDVRGCVLV